MSDERWKHRRQGAIVAVVLMVAAGLAWAWHRELGHAADLLTERERAEAAEALGATLGREVKELRLVEADARALAESWQERSVHDRQMLAGQVRLTERAEARARQQPAPIERVVRGDPVFIEGPVRFQDCEVSDVTIGGGGPDGLVCRMQRLEIEGRPALRVEWWARATAKVNGSDLAIDPGGWQVAEVEYEVAKEPPPIRPRLTVLQAGVFAESEQFGVRGGMARWKQGRRLGWWADADLALEGATELGEGLYYQADRWRVAGGPVWRFGP